MKKSFTALLICLFFGQTPVMADPGRWHQQRMDVVRTAPQAHANLGYRGHFGGRAHPNHRRHGPGWAPWVSAAVIGSTLYWAGTYTPPTTTVIVSPPVVSEPARVAYFCQTSQQYYPNVPVCTVPWQMVSY